MEMTTEYSLRRLLHRATHRIPAVPAHAERPAGHQGTAVHDRGRRRGDALPSLNHRWNHSPARPARFLPSWQRRIAAIFGREM
jgi:hypothetical protein